MTTRVALQTFTVRRYLQSPEVIEQGFARIAALGIKAIELAYVPLKPAVIDAVDAARKRHGIDVGSSQITFDILSKQREQVLRFLRQLECDVTAVSVLPWKGIVGGRDKLLQFCRELDALGAWYREQGVALCYHHHDFEFRRYGDEMGLDLILNNTAPENVCLELDTYWVQRGGGSPQELIAELGSRVKVVHLRDYRIRWKWFELLPIDTELGQGNLNFDHIIQACCNSGVRYMAIEQATKNPYDSVAKSVQHLHALGYSHLF